MFIVPQTTIGRNAMNGLCVTVRTAVGEVGNRLTRLVAGRCRVRRTLGGLGLGLSSAVLMA